MSAILRFTGFALAVLLVATQSTAVRAANAKDVEAAIKRGAGFLKQRVLEESKDAEDDNTPGVRALMGLALLEAGLPADDPAIKSIAGFIRKASYSQTKTYNISLSLLFLDRLGDPADAPLVQMLGIRLLAGQTQMGGWGYECVERVPAGELQKLRAGLKVSELTADTTKSVSPGTNPAAAAKTPKKLHAEVLRYAGTLVNRRPPPDGDDNSNTQFGIIGVWVARRHGVDAENCLALVEVRFLRSQTPAGGWSYKPGEGVGPSMTCAGLLGVATGLARRDEKRLTAEPKLKPKPEPPAVKSNDPFFNPPKSEVEAKKRPVSSGPPDVREFAARRGLAALYGHLGGLPAQPGIISAIRGNADLYFLWSVERVGVVYDLDKIFGLDWYDIGANILLRTQAPAGSWNYQGDAEVGTPFALLFLCKANLTKDLKATKDEGQFSELRSGSPGEPPPTSNVPPAPAVVAPKPSLPVQSLPKPVADEGAPIAAELLKVPDADWAMALAKLRDAKGAAFTRGLVLAVGRLEGERRKDARDALAERLTRMTAATLREMLKADEPELRRAAALACAMKDDAGHIPDLIEKLSDESAVVWLAAKAGLKSLTNQDFGPPATATAEDRRRAADAWKAWHAKKGK